jgi:hypothetical protein
MARSQRLAVNSPDKKTVPVWSVRKIHVEGQGKLNLPGLRGFVLQLEIERIPVTNHIP